MRNKHSFLSSFLCILIIALFIPVLAFADDADDDFDSMFDDAPADVVVEEAEVPTVDNVSSNNETEAEPEKGQTTIIIKEASSPIKFSGNVSSNIGIAATYDGEEWDKGGALKLSNTFNMKVKPASDFTLHMSFATSESSLKVDVSKFYFDYLWKDFYISAGKKKLTWGNIRLFDSSTYGTVLTNPAADVITSKTPLVAEIQVPFLGNWTFVGAGKASSSSVDWKQMKYAASYEVILGQTNIDLYATKYQFETETDIEKKAIGFELKRTILDFDFYGQALCRFEGAYKKAVGTAGFYRLWETDGPDFGINAEYQFIHDRTVLEPEVPEIHKIAVEAGLKQLGKKKNIKIGTQWGHNITHGTGFANVALLIGSIFPHANWTTAVTMNYDEGFKITDCKVGTTISLSVKY